MKDWKKLVGVIVWAVATCFLASPLLAQQEGGDKPKPAAREYPPLIEPIGNQDESDQGAQTLSPDTSPVSGVQNPTLGTSEIRHSYWVPGIRYSNSAGSNQSTSGGNSQWNTTSFVSGDVSLLEAWSQSLLSLNYSGGGFASTDSVQGSGQYHQLAATYQVDRRRWQALFVDQFSYLPQSSFGFGGTSGLSAPGISGTLAVPLPGLQSTYVPGQSILTAVGPRYSNASAAQLSFRLSRRGSITVAGVYSLLRFTQSGNISSDTEIFNIGYNYAITRKDTVGVVYNFSAYHYRGDPQALGDHVVMFVYGKMITGRLGLRLGGGPEFTKFRVPILGATQRVSGTVNGSLIYAFSHSDVTLGYTHGISGGSGVLNGSNSDQLRATWERQLTRVWNASLSFQYARNGEIVSAIGQVSPTFNSLVVGAGLSRPLGRATNFSIGYQAQIQGGNSAICTTANCSTNTTANQIFLSFQWHGSPLVLR
jgi:hypothetical protein